MRFVRLRRVGTAVALLLTTASLQGCLLWYNEYYFREESVTGNLNDIAANDSWYTTGHLREKEFYYIYRILDVSFASSYAADVPEAQVGDVFAFTLGPELTPVLLGNPEQPPGERPADEFMSANPNTLIHRFSPVSPSNVRGFRVVGRSSDEETRRTIDRVAATVVDTGIDSAGVLSWGRWTGPSLRSGNDFQCCTADDSLHYVVGATTPNAGIPQSGTAVFNLVGATAPTISGGGSPSGVLDAGSRIGVAWGGATSATRIGVELAGNVADQYFELLTVGGADAPLSSSIAYDPGTRTFSGPAGGDSGGGDVSGFFAGGNASHIGLTYRANIDGGTAQGAAAFRR